MQSKFYLKKPKRTAIVITTVICSYAGNTLWNGVLIALDATTDVRKNLKRNQRVDFQDYQKTVVVRLQNVVRNRAAGKGQVN